MVEAIDEVIRTRPASRAAMSLSNHLARRTVAVTFRSMIASSSSRSFCTNGPP